MWFGLGVKHTPNSWPSGCERNRTTIGKMVGWLLTRIRQSITFPLYWWFGGVCFDLVWSKPNCKCAIRPSVTVWLTGCKKVKTNWPLGLLLKQRIIIFLPLNHCTSPSPLISGGERVGQEAGEGLGGGWRGTTQQHVVHSSQSFTSNDVRDKTCIRKFSLSPPVHNFYEHIQPNTQ